MKKTPSRKTSTDRRKSPRTASRPEPEALTTGCAHCARTLGPGERALFVEEEVGRTFCSEECIGGYFSHDVERLEAEFQELVRPGDLSGSEREELMHLRWGTLREPDEVWRQKTLSGDFRYHMISQFEVAGRQVWCVCISLFLKGEPSFLYLTAITRNSSVAEHYRRGERVSWVKRNSSEKNLGRNPDFSTEQQALDGTVIPNSDPDLMEAAGFSTAPADGLALDGWSTEEALRASVNGERSADDIPPEEFSAYQSCIEETLQGPDELWSMEAVGEDEEVRLYHFIKHYPKVGESGFWYVIVAREVPASESEEEHLEVLDAFPTRDPELAQRYRAGNAELESEPGEIHDSTRVLH